MQRDGLNGRGEAVVDPVGGEVDLSSLASALWRRKRWIIIPTLIAGAVAAIYVTLATPQYKSQALVLIENRETPFNRPQSSVAGGEFRKRWEAKCSSRSRATSCGPWRAI